MKRLLISLVLAFAATGCTAAAPDEAAPSTSEQAPAPTPDALAPGNYAFVTRSGAEGVVSIPSLEGARSVAVSVDNRGGTDPVSLTGVTIHGADGDVLFTNPSGKAVPPRADENIVFTGEEIPSTFYGVSIVELEGTSVRATPVE